MGIGTYDERVHESVESVLQLYPDARTDETLWPQVKQAFIALLYDHKRPGVRRDVLQLRRLPRARPHLLPERVHLLAPGGGHRVHRRGRRHLAVPGTRPSRDLLSTFRAIARSLGLSVPVRGPAARSAQGAARLPGSTCRVGASASSTSRSRCSPRSFFRDMGAYVVGRILNGNQQTPFVACLRHSAVGARAARGRAPAQGRAPGGAVQPLARLLHRRHGRAVRVRRLPQPADAGEVEGRAVHLGGAAEAGQDALLPGPAREPEALHRRVRPRARARGGW